MCHKEWAHGEPFGPLTDFHVHSGHLVPTEYPSSKFCIRMQLDMVCSFNFGPKSPLLVSEQNEVFRTTQVALQRCTFAEMTSQSLTSLAAMNIE